MEISLYQIMFILGRIARTYIVYRFFRLFYLEKQRRETYVEIFLYLVFFLVVTIVGFVGNPSPVMQKVQVRYYTTDISSIEVTTVWMLLAEVLCMFGVTFYYSRNLRKNLLVVMGMCSIFIISEMIAFWMIKMTNGMKFMCIEVAATFKLIASTMLIYAMVYFLVDLKNLQKGVKNLALYWAFLLLLPGGTCVLILKLLLQIGYGNVFVTDRRESFTIIAIFILGLLLFWVYDHIFKTMTDSYEKMLIQKENQYYEGQLKNMEQSMMAWKKMKHDLKNHFIVLRGLLDEEKGESAKYYLDRLIQEDVTGKKEIQTGNTVIDSIVNYKIMDAEQRGCSVDLDIQIPEQLKVSSHAMSVILGNALDNAIEAVEKTAEKRIHLILQYTKGRLLIQIKNPYKGKLRKDDAGALLTGKSEKDYHGFGLKSIKDTIEKNSGVMHIDTSGQWFILTVLLYVSET